MLLLVPLLVFLTNLFEIQQKRLVAQMKFPCFVTDLLGTSLTMTLYYHEFWMNRLQITLTVLLQTSKESL